MIPKSGYRFSEEIMLQSYPGMIPKSGYRFSDQIMLQSYPGMIPKSGHRFSEEIMLQSKARLEHRHGVYRDAFGNSLIHIKNDAVRGAPPAADPL